MPDRPLVPPMRTFFAIAAGLALVAGILLFVLSSQTEDTFSWTIDPPLTAAFLGGAYWAALVLFVWALRQRAWSRAAVVLPPVAAIAVLLLVTTLIHSDRFHHDLFGRFWVAAYVVVVVALPPLLWSQLRLGATGPAPADGSLPSPLRLLLALQAVCMLGVGAALLVDPTGSSGVWSWALTPLTARAVGSFLVGFGVSAAHASLAAEPVRFAGAALAYLTLGALELVAVARYSDLIDLGRAADLGYVAFLVSVLVAGVAGLACARSASARSGS